jgi:adenylate cyclase
MKRLRTAFRNPAIASVLLGLGVFALIAGAREYGLLQPAEILAYDKAIVWRAGASTTDPRIALVEITESDIGKYDFPVPDDLLARLLETIARAQPTAIGLDIYRDAAVPRDGSRLPELNRVLRQYQNIVGIFGFGDLDHPIKIPFAPALADTPERYGFNDFPFEFGAVRRAFLLVWDNQHNIYPSFSLALAMQAGVAPEQTDSGMRIGKALIPRFERNEGGYVRADDGGHQFLLDFKSPRKFITHSLDDVLSNRVSDETWRGKIVLIGEGAESAHDFENTPLQVNMPGVELHAQAVNQLLRAAERGDKVTTSWSEPAELAWILAWCALGVAIGFFIRKPIALLAVCCGVVAALVAICWIAFTRDFWLPLVPALGGNIAATAIITGYTRYLDRKDRETLMRLFSQHVSRAIAESMWEHREEFMDGNRPRPQKLAATVLFTDLRNFSTVAEKLEAPQVMEWMNEYMQALAHLVEEHSGFINKYMGDAIMAVFGFPMISTTEAGIKRDAENAVRCALDMGNELRRLNENWEKLGRAQVQMRVGIFSGPAVAGCIGSTERLEFTVMGNTVNTAARLESFAKDYATDDLCRILIGHPTFELLDGKFPTEFVQTIELKGKDEKTTIYRILGSSL